MAGRDIKLVQTTVSQDGTWTLHVTYYGAMRKSTKALQRAALLYRASNGTCSSIIAIVDTWTSPFQRGAGGAISGQGVSSVTRIRRSTSADRRSLTVTFSDPRLVDHVYCAVDSLTLSHFTRYDSAERIPLRPTT